MKKTKKIDRNPRVVYKKQQSFHYSSKRSYSDEAQRRVDATDGKNKSKHANKFLGNLPGLLALLLVLAGLVYLFTLSTAPSIIVTNQETTDDNKGVDNIKSVAEAEIKKSIFNRFKPTFNEQRLSDALTALSPEINAVNVRTLPFAHQVQIEVDIASPKLLLSNGSRLYVVADNGKVLADVTSDELGYKLEDLPLVQDETNIDISVGKIALTTAQIAFIEEIMYQAQANSLIIGSMTLPAGGSELEVRYGGLEYYVKYNFFEDARQSSGVFIATKDKLLADGRSPKEYIDVRVPERAYVK